MVWPTSCKSGFPKSSLQIWLMDLSHSQNSRREVKAMASFWNMLSSKKLHVFIFLEALWDSCQLLVEIAWTWWKREHSVEMWLKRSDLRLRDWVGPSEPSVQVLQPSFSWVWDKTKVRALPSSRQRVLEGREHGWGKEVLWCLWPVALVSPVILHSRARPDKSLSRARSWNALPCGSSVWEGLFPIILSRGVMGADCTHRRPCRSTQQGIAKRLVSLFSGVLHFTFSFFSLGFWESSSPGCPSSSSCL